ncbi:hypothetical protein Fcan01_11240 [Folsomia candida]|uniref:Uncharacterized protein n=1 Tax=Folsomia candida TaxID=158441 RepID=A0A226EAI5_FOLCA|nr:hypothetical protein Fcan01_11240 [Folsomia candida]
MLRMLGRDLSRHISTCRQHRKTCFAQIVTMRPHPWRRGASNIGYFDLQWICSINCGTNQTKIGPDSTHIIVDSPLPRDHVVVISSTQICIVQNDLAPNYDSAMYRDTVKSPDIADETCPPPSYTECLQNKTLNR